MTEKEIKQERTINADVLSFEELKKKIIENLTFDKFISYHPRKNIYQYLVNCSLGYIYQHIGTRKFLTKPLWVYSHLKSGFLFLQKVT